MEHEHTPTNYTLNDFLPLIIIASTITAITIAHQLLYGFNMHDAMRIFMASFFLVFGFFKVINLDGFAKAYAMYDIVAQQFSWYGYIYPFLELGLGFAYLFNWNPLLTNWITLIVMLISAVGVFNELRKGKEIVCACLGTLFKIPMTYVTLIEDLLMAAMTAWMLFA